MDNIIFNKATAVQCLNSRPLISMDDRQTTKHETKTLAASGFIVLGKFASTVWLWRLVYHPNYYSCGISTENKRLWTCNVNMSELSIYWENEKSKIFSKVINSVRLADWPSWALCNVGKIGFARIGRSEKIQLVTRKNRNAENGQVNDYSWPSEESVWSVCWMRWAWLWICRGTGY